MMKLNSLEEQVYKDYKPLLFSIAYRMLGSVAEAEDIVQEAFLTFFQQDVDRIQNKKAFLCKIAANLCIDTLKSARKKREQYTGPWLPEPFLVGDQQTDPVNQVIVNDTLSISYLFLMENLSPNERAVFILREAFAFSYKEITEIINKSEMNCRKIYERAKRKLGSTSQETKLNNKKNKRIMTEFIHAFQQGDLKKVLNLLSEEVILYSDGGGIVKAAIYPIISRDRVLPFLLGIAAKAPKEFISDIREINGEVGVVNTVRAAPHSVICFQVLDEQIEKIFIIMNPEKLKHLK
jgi:RNA polymerase sigma-70 factor, ECF subfamily